MPRFPPKVYPPSAAAGLRSQLRLPAYQQQATVTIMLYTIIAWLRIRKFEFELCKAFVYTSTAVSNFERIKKTFHMGAMNSELPSNIRAISLHRDSYIFAAASITNS